MENIYPLSSPLMTPRAKPPVDDFYPAPYHAADQQSIIGQRRYKNLFLIEIGILLLAAGASLLPLKQEAKILPIILAILFLTELIIRWYIHRSGVQDNWYNGRAIAESIKTMTWKFAMRPYTDASQQGIEREHHQFNNQVEQIMKVWKDTGSKNSKPITTPFISQNLLAIKSLKDWTKKRALYDESRILNQQEWYDQRAKKNKRLSNLFYYLIMLCYAVALVCSVYFISYPDQFNLTPIFGLFASSILAWTQLNDYKDLKNAYSLAHYEINGIIKEMANTNEENFYQHVEDIEHAFSREHTIWIARRDSDSVNAIVKNPKS